MSTSDTYTYYVIKQGSTPKTRKFVATDGPGKGREYEVDVEDGKFTPEGDSEKWTYTRYPDGSIGYDIRVYFNKVGETASQWEFPDKDSTKPIETPEAETSTGEVATREGATPTAQPVEGATAASLEPTSITIESLNDVKKLLKEEYTLVEDLESSNFKVVKTTGDKTPVAILAKGPDGKLYKLVFTEVVKGNTLLKKGGSRRRQSLKTTRRHKTRRPRRSLRKSRRSTRRH